MTRAQFIAQELTEEAEGKLRIGPPLTPFPPVKRFWFV